MGSGKDFYPEIVLCFRTLVCLLNNLMCLSGGMQIEAGIRCPAFYQKGPGSNCCDYIPDIRIPIKVGNQLRTAEIGSVNRIMLGSGGIADDVCGFYSFVKKGDIGGHRFPKGKSHTTNSVLIYLFARQQKINDSHPVKNICP